MSTPERSLDSRFAASSKSWKLKLRSWKHELEKLPPNGTRWKWSDVVGDDDSQIDLTVARRVKEAFDRFEVAGGLEFETPSELQAYLEGELGRELTGEALLSDDQTTLPGTSTGGESGARGARDDAGREASDDTPVRQRTLTGGERRVTSHDDERGGRSERDDEWVKVGWNATAKERAAQHPSQEVLTAFNTRTRGVDNSVALDGWVVDPAPAHSVGVTG